VIHLRGRYGGQREEITGGGGLLAQNIPCSEKKSILKGNLRSERVRLHWMLKGPASTKPQMGEGLDEKEGLKRKKFKHSVGGMFVKAMKKKVDWC